MDESKVIKVVSVDKPEITVGRPEGLGSDLEVRVDGEPLVTVHYVYPWIDNASQYYIAEKIAKMFKGEE